MVVVGHLTKLKERKVVNQVLARCLRDLIQRGEFPVLLSSSAAADGHGRADNFLEW